MRDIIMCMGGCSIPFIALLLFYGYTVWTFNHNSKKRRLATYYKKAKVK